MLIKSLYTKFKSINVSEKDTKIAKRVGFIVVTFFFTLTYMSGIMASSGDTADAQDWCFDSSGSHEESIISDEETGDDAVDGENVVRTQGASIANFMMSVGLREANCEYEAVASNPNISTFNKVGLVGFADRTVMALVQDIPTQNVYAHLVDEWVPGKDSSAGVYAGGYEDLVDTGIGEIWEFVRNISYLIFVILLIVAGFAIMFRQKIGGQLSVTIFNTLPNIVVGLILVTFSFAIVGLLINFGGIIMNVIASIFGFASPADGTLVTGPFSLFTAALSGEGLVGNIESWGGVSAIIGIVGSIVALSVGTGGLALAAIAGVFAVGGIIVALIALMIIGIVIGASIKVFITLLKAYIGLLIDVVLAPLYLTLGSFPGKNNVRMDWLKRVTKNVLTFPLVFFFINLGSWIFASNFNFTFPPTLMGGASSAGVDSGTLFMTIIKGFVMIYLFYVAGNAPKMLDDILPVAGGKGTAEALSGAAKGAFGKIPILGSNLG